MCPHSLCPLGHTYTKKKYLLFIWKTNSNLTGGPLFLLAKSNNPTPRWHLATSRRLCGLSQLQRDRGVVGCCSIFHSAQDNQKLSRSKCQQCWGWETGLWIPEHTELPTPLPPIPLAHMASFPQTIKWCGGGLTDLPQMSTNAKLQGYGENGIQNCVTSQHRSGMNYGERNTQLRENV